MPRLVWIHVLLDWPINGTWIIYRWYSIDVFNLSCRHEYQVDNKFAFRKLVKLNILNGKFIRIECRITQYIPAQQHWKHRPAAKNVFKRDEQNRKKIYYWIILINIKMVKLVFNLYGVAGFSNLHFFYLYATLSNLSGLNLPMAHHGNVLVVWGWYKVMISTVQTVIFVCDEIVEFRMAKTAT